MTWNIDHSSCISCDICKLDCPSTAIKGTPPQIDWNRCIACGHCFSICPQDSVQLSFDQDLNEMDKASVSYLIRNKRSVRRYKKDQIPKETLDSLIETGFYSASASNKRDIKILLLNDSMKDHLRKETAKKLLSLLNITSIPLVPWILSFTSMKSYSSKKKVRELKERFNKTVSGEKDSIFFGAPSVVLVLYPKSNHRFGLVDSAYAATNIMFDGESRGIASCHIGFSTVALQKKKLRKQLGLPKGYMVGQVFTLGYPTVDYKRLPPRAIERNEREYSSFHWRRPINET